jgi:hypothetical protein
MCFIFEKLQVKIIAQRLAVVTEIFVVFLSPSQANAGLVPKINP